MLNPVLTFNPFVEKSGFVVELSKLVPKTPEFCKVIGVEELLIVMSVFVTPNVTPEPAFRPLVLKFGFADVDPNKDSPPIVTDDKFIPSILSLSIFNSSIARVVSAVIFV